MRGQSKTQQNCVIGQDRMCGGPSTAPCVLHMQSYQKSQTRVKRPMVYKLECVKELRPQQREGEKRKVGRIQHFPKVVVFRDPN